MPASLPEPVKIDWDQIQSDQSDAALAEYGITRAGRQFVCVDWNISIYDAKENTYTRTPSHKGANCVISKRADGLHVPCIDYDKAELTEEHEKYLLDLFGQSTWTQVKSANNWHLYGDTPLEWAVYKEALVQAGAGPWFTLQTGYVLASINRGFSSLRLPWEKKEVVKKEEIPPMDPDGQYRLFLKRHMNHTMIFHEKSSLRSFTSITGA